MKKVILFFLINIIAAYGAMETSLFRTFPVIENIEFLIGVISISVFGLFSIEMYKNRKNKI